MAIYPEEAEPSFQLQLPATMRWKYREAEWFRSHGYYHDIIHGVWHSPDWLYTLPDNLVGQFVNVGEGFHLSSWLELVPVPDSPTRNDTGEAVNMINSNPTSAFRRGRWCRPRQWFLDNGFIDSGAGSLINNNLLGNPRDVASPMMDHPVLGSLYTYRPEWIIDYGTPYTPDPTYWCKPAEWFAQNGFTRHTTSEGTHGWLDTSVDASSDTQPVFVNDAMVGKPVDTNRWLYSPEWVMKESPYNKVLQAVKKREKQLLSAKKALQELAFVLGRQHLESYAYRKLSSQLAEVFPTLPGYTISFIPDQQVKIVCPSISGRTDALYRIGTVRGVNSSQPGTFRVQEPSGTEGDYYAYALEPVPPIPANPQPAADTSTTIAPAHSG